MGLNEAVKALNFDTRLLDWNLKYNHITFEDIKKYMESLPDMSSNVTLVSLEEEPASNMHTH